MRNAGLEETQAAIKIARRNINNLRYADDTTLMAKSEEELKSLLMKVKEELYCLIEVFNARSPDSDPAFLRRKPLQIESYRGKHRWSKESISTKKKVNNNEHSD